MRDNRLTEAELVIAQQTKAFAALIWFSRGIVALSLPLSILAASVYRSAIEVPENRGLFLAALTLLGSGIWAAYFYRRIHARGLSPNDVLRRLSQAALTSSYPALVGLAVALVNSSGVSILPFGILAVGNIETIRKIGRNILAAQRGGVNGLQA